MGAIVSFLVGPGAGFIKSYWKQLLVLAVMVVIYLYWQDRTTTIHEQQDEIVQLKADKATLVEQLISQKAEFKRTVDEQNTQIEGFVKKSEEQQKQIADAQKRRSDVVATYEKTIDSILHSSKPKTCQDSINYLVDGTKDLKWETSK